MGFADYLVLGIIAVILLVAIRYIRASKKKGKTCIGCPHSAVCAAHRGGSCGCNKE